MTNIADANTKNQLSRYEKTLALCFALGLAAGPVAPALMGVALVIGVLMLFRYAWDIVGVADVKRCLVSPVGVCLSLAMIWFFISSGFSLDPAKSFQVSARTSFVFFAATIFFLVLQRRPVLREFLLSKLILAFGVWLVVIIPIGISWVFKIDFYWLDSVVWLKNDASLAILFLPMFLLTTTQASKGKRFILILLSISAFLLIYGYGIDELKNRSGLFAVGLSV
ncbi:MAG: hypothetical protein R3261_10715, partial [Alphaproteobacteria bacterium]|nr:hypothetical protein [Alphaproteobacteria bacterium]